MEVAPSDRRRLTLNSLQLRHSWANESGGRSYGSLRDSENGFEESTSDGCGVGFENGVWAIAISPATQC